jgi:hypothetical protein
MKSMMPHSITGLERVNKDCIFLLSVFWTFQQLEFFNNCVLSVQSFFKGTNWTGTFSSKQHRWRKEIVSETMMEKLKMKENVQNNMQVYYIMSNFSAQYCFKMNTKNYLQGSGKCTFYHKHLNHSVTVHVMKMVMKIWHYLLSVWEK